jgi:hypothetical protein
VSTDVLRQTTGTAGGGGAVAKRPALVCSRATGGKPPAGQEVMFDQDSSAILPGGAADVVKFMSTWKGGDIFVDGYASTDGGDWHNWTLSCARAEAVKAELVRHGVGVGRVFTTAHGEVTDFSTATLEPNRRAVIHEGTVPPPVTLPPTGTTGATIAATGAASASTALPSAMSSVDCTTSNLSEISAALPIAKDMLNKAHRYLLGPSDPRVDAVLQKYFNDHSASTYLHVIIGINALIAGYASGYRLECEHVGSFMYSWFCGGGLAYTKLAFTNLHLCDAAFGRSDVDLAETINHESSHKFNSTSDHAYCWGGSCPSSLSTSNALDNADSFSKLAWDIYTTLP